MEKKDIIETNKQQVYILEILDVNIRDYELEIRG